MDFGREVPEGHLPVFSVSDEKEAKALIVLSCGTNLNGDNIARELAEDQTIENLEAFSTRLDQGHEVLMRTNGCRCVKQ